MELKHYHEHVDGYVVLEKKKKGRYSLYFQPRNSIRKLLECTYTDKAKAMDDFYKASDYTKGVSIWDLLHDNYEKKKSNKGWLGYSFFLRSIPEVLNPAILSLPIDIKIIAALSQSPVEDKQQYQLYKFQKSVPELLELSMTVVEEEQAQGIVDPICEYYGVPKVKVECNYDMDAKNSFYNRTEQKIDFRNPTKRILLHEVAHHVHAQLTVNKYGSEVPQGTWHGPEFTKILIDVYARFGGADRQDMVKVANEMGLLGPNHKARKSLDQKFSRDLLNI